MPRIWETSEKVQELIKKAKVPDLTEIGPIARELGITSTSTFWEFFEWCRLRWAENRSTKAD